MRKSLAILAAVLTATALAACKPTVRATDTKADVTSTVQQANAAVATSADLSDPKSFADARRGFIASPEGQIKDAGGNVIWDFGAFAFVKGEAPPTVNPSLWRQALLNNQVGLFKVADRMGVLLRLKLHALRQINDGILNARR